MAKLLGLLVAAEGFVPVAGRVYAQDDDGSVWWYVNQDMHFHAEDGQWCIYPVGACEHDFDLERSVPLADDYQESTVRAESILEARACL